MTEKWRSHYWRLSIPFTRARWLLWVLGGGGYFRNIMLLPFPNPAKVNIHNRAKSDRCLPFLFQFSSCLAGLAVYSIIQFSRHKYLLSGPKFRAGRLRDSGDPGSGSGSLALVTIFSLIREKWSAGLTPGPGLPHMQWILTSQAVLWSVAWGIVNFRSDLDGGIYHDNDGSHSTPLLLLRLVERMEWKGYSNIHSLSPSFYTLPCEVYFQEAISIYKADFNLSIDLCFQGSLRKLFAEEGQRIPNVFQLKYVPFCVYKNSKLLSNKDICKIFKHTCVDVAFFLTFAPNILFTFPHITLAGSELNIQVNFNFVKYAQ